MIMLLILLFVQLSLASTQINLCTNVTIQDFATSTCSVGVPTSCGKTSVGGIYCYQPMRSRQIAGNTMNHTECTSVDGTNCSGCNIGFLCKGNTQYCNIFGCDSHSPCTCTFTQYDTVIERLIGGIWTTTTPVTVQVLGPQATYTMPSSNPNPFGYQMSLYNKRSVMRRTNSTNTTTTFSVTTTLSTTSPSPRSSLTTITFDQPTLNVLTPYPAFTRVALTKDGIQSLYGCAQNLCTNEVDSPYFINPGDLVVSVYINDTLDNTQTFPVTSFLTCDVPRCILCQMMYQNFSCFPWEFQVLLISMTVAAILGSIVLLMALFRGMCMFSCCRKCGKKAQTTIELNWGKIKDKIKKKMKKTSTARPESDADSSVNEETENVPLSLIRNTRPREFMLSPLVIAILFLPLVLAANCANGITVPVSVNDCTANGNVETCTVMFQSLVSIPAPGLSACLTFVKSNNVPLGELDITYSAMIQVAPVQSLYYTSDWVGMSYSLKHCPWETMCGSCSNYNPVTNPCACDSGGSNCIFTGAMCAYPGASRCDSQCGCAGCGCFACDASCVYSRAEIVPNWFGGPHGICQVFRPVSVILQPQLTTNFTYTITEPVWSWTQEIHNISVVGLTTQIGDNFTLTMEGTLAGSTVQFGGEKLIGCSDGWYMGSACDPNAPVAHAVGDIQGNSLLDLEYGGHFQYATGLFTPLLTSSATNYVFEAAGIRSISPSSTLPAQRGSVLWTVSGSNLVGLDQAPGAVIMTVATNQPLTLKRIVNLVCPKILSGNITGCYSCDQGATITLLAYSRCSSGQALVVATGSYIVSTPSVILGTSQDYIMIKVTSNSATVSGNIQLVNGDYSDTILIEGTLVPDPLIVINNQTFSNTSSTAQAMLDFGSWFNGLAEWMKGLLVTGMTIAAIVAAIVIAVVIFKVVKAVKQSNLEAKYEKLTEQQQRSMIRKMQMSQLKDSDF